MEKLYTFILTLLWVELAVNSKYELARNYSVLICLLLIWNNYRDICMNFDKNHIVILRRKFIKVFLCYEFF